MMKSLKKIAAVGGGLALTLGLATSNINLAFAENVNISNAIVAEAIADAGNAHSGITYVNDRGGYFTLAAGDYVLADDINLGNYSLLVSDGDTTIDLGGHTLTSTFYNNTEAMSNELTQAILVQEKSLTITNGKITLADIFYDAVAAYSDDETKPTTLNMDGVDVTGSLHVGTSATATFGSSMKVNGTINAERGAKVTINGGTYSNDDSGTVGIGSNAEVTIEGGTFTTERASAVYVIGGNPADTTSLTVNGGTFTSANDKGIEAFMTPNMKVTINGGTFTGAMSGILMYGDTFGVILNGGTFNYTDTTHGLGAIVASGTDTATLNSMLGAGRSYSDAAARAVPDDFDPIVVLTNTTVKIVTGATEDESGIGAPDSGVVTAAGGSAKAEIAIAGATALTAGTFAIALAKGKKKAQK